MTFAEQIRARVAPLQQRLVALRAEEKQIRLEQGQLVAELEGEQAATRGTARAVVAGQLKRAEREHADAAQKARDAGAAYQANPSAEATKAFTELSNDEQARAVHVQKLRSRLESLPADPERVAVRELVEHFLGSTPEDMPSELRLQVEMHTAEHRGRLASLATKHGVHDV